jgi:hypothetical protein
MQTLAGRIARDGGAALVIDYGHAETGLGETLQAVARHAYTDPLAAPGEADLTAHVDFAALARAARSAGAVAHGPIGQGAFLSALGLAQRAARLSRDADAATRAAIAAWAEANLAPTSTVVSDGLACFAGVTDIGCTHQPTVVGTRKPKDLPMFRWVNTVLGNLKTGFSGAYHSFDFGKYAERYLGTIAYRFNRRFDLRALPTRLLAAATACGPRPEPWIRRVAEAPF